MIVVDTSVWSLAFRRRSWPGGAIPGVVKLIRRLSQDDQRLVVPGIVLQELLSGVKDPVQSGRLMELMRGYPLLLATREQHIEAAHISNLCRKAGVAAATVDCLIAAQCIMGNRALLTIDEDFKRISKHCALRLFPIPFD